MKKYRMMTELVSTSGGGAAQLTSYAQVNHMLLIGTASNILAMVGMVVISSLKPWGRRVSVK